MSLYAIEGTIGAGKTYVAVNGWEFLRGILLDTDRPVATNLPLEMDWFVQSLSKKVATQESYRRRIQFLRPGLRPVMDREWVNGEGEVIPWPESADEARELRECGCHVRFGESFMADGVRQFWYFIKPNSVVFLDETADIFGTDSVSGGKRERLEDGAVNAASRSILRSFINHHRHYKVDLFFFMQNREDVDVHVRRKILYVYYIENMKHANMFEWWALRGLRWPIQNFRVRVFQGRKVLGKGSDFDSFEFLRTYRIWPNRRGFKNYRSFSAAVGLRGMRQVAGEEERSTDMDSVWHRVRDFLAEAWAPLCVLGFIGVAVYLVIQLLYGMAGLKQDRVMNFLNRGKAKPVVAAPVVSVPVGSVVVTNPVAKGNNEEDERVQLWSSGMVKTNRRRLVVGDRISGDRIVEITSDALVFASGRTVGRSEFLGR